MVSTAATASIIAAATNRLNSGADSVSEIVLEVDSAVAKLPNLVDVHLVAALEATADPSSSVSKIVVAFSCL